MNQTDRLAKTLTVMELVELDAFEATLPELGHSQAYDDEDYDWYELSVLCGDRMDLLAEVSDEIIARRKGEKYEEFCS